MKIIYALSAAFIVGVLATLQAVTNAQLGSVSGLPSVGGVFCYLTGTILMLIGILIHSSKNKIPLFRFSSEKQPTFLDFMGGFCGGLYMISAVYFSPMLGAALFFSLAIVGQLACACLCDHFGFGGLPIARITPSKMLSLCIAIGGVAIGAMEDAAQSPPDDAPDQGTYLANMLGNEVNIRPLIRLFICGVVLVSGAMQPLQATLNWRLSLTLPHKIQAMVFSFFFSFLITTGLTSALFLFGTKSPKVVFENFITAPWYAYIGGPLQGAVVAGGIFIPSRIGTALYYCILLSGELVCSLFVDMFGALGMPKRGFDFTSVFGVAVVLLAAIAMQNAAKLDALLLKHFAWLLPCINRFIGADITKELYESVVPEDEKQAEVVASVVAGASCITSLNEPTDKDSLLADYDPIDCSTLSPASSDPRPDIDVTPTVSDSNAYTSPALMSTGLLNERPKSIGALPPRTPGLGASSPAGRRHSMARTPISSRQFAMLHGKYLVPLPTEPSFYDFSAGYNAHSETADGRTLNFDDDATAAAPRLSSTPSSPTMQGLSPPYPKFRSPVNSSGSLGLPPLAPLAHRDTRRRGNTFNLDTSLTNKEFWSLPSSSLVDPTPSILQQDAMESALPLPSFRTTMANAKNAIGRVFKSAGRGIRFRKRNHGATAYSDEETIPFAPKSDDSSSD